MDIQDSDTNQTNDAKNDHGASVAKEMMAHGIVTHRYDSEERCEKTILSIWYGYFPMTINPWVLALGS